MAFRVAVAATSVQRGVCMCMHVRAKGHLLLIANPVANGFTECFRVITDT